MFLNYEDALKKLKYKSPTQIDNNSILKRGAFIIPKISLVSDSLPNFQITGAPCKKANERRKQKLWKKLIELVGKDVFEQHIKPKLKEGANYFFR